MAPAYFKKIKSYDQENISLQKYTFVPALKPKDKVIAGIIVVPYNSVHLYGNWRP